MFRLRLLVANYFFACGANHAAVRLPKKSPSWGLDESTHKWIEWSSETLWTRDKRRRFVFQECVLNWHTYVVLYSTYSSFPPSVILVAD